MVAPQVNHYCLLMHFTYMYSPYWFRNIQTAMVTTRYQPRSQLPNYNENSCTDMFQVQLVHPMSPGWRKSCNSVILLAVPYQHNGQRWH
jgi:hypothetical protein